MVQEGCLVSAHPNKDGPSFESDDKRIEDLSNAAVGIIERFDTSVIEAIIIAKIPEEIREEVKRKVYERTGRRRTQT